MTTFEQQDRRGHGHVAGLERGLRSLPEQRQKWARLRRAARLNDAFHAGSRALPARPPGGRQ